MFRKSILLLAVLLVSLSSCTKDDICGVVTQGDSRFNDYTMEWEYFLYVDGDRRLVDQKTYESYGINDGICLTY